MNNQAIVCREIKRHFGSGDARVDALRGVNLEVPMGELTMLVGPSGCGKTTLLSIIAGILDPNSGEVDVFGNSLHAMSDRQLTQFRLENLAFIFQDFNLLPGLSAAENVAVPLIVAGTSRSSAIHAARQTLEKFGLGDRGNERPAKLSGGEQQRVAVARALVAKPRLVVCDEPTASLDAQTGDVVMQELQKLVDDEERAVVVVTHDSRIFSYADSIARMEDGRVTRHERSTEAVT